MWIASQMALAPISGSACLRAVAARGLVTPDWARVELDKPEQQGWQRSLVIRRSLVEGEKPADLASVLVFAPCATTLSEMVVAIGTRWTVEQCLEEGKGEVGLDQ